MFSGLQSFLRRAKTSELCKISELQLDSHCAINMMLIYKLTKVNMCVLLREHHDVTFGENYAAAYSP